MKGLWDVHVQAAERTAAVTGPANMVMRLQRELDTLETSRARPGTRSRRVSLGESETPDIVEPKQESSRRGRMAVIAALAAAIPTFVCPALMFPSNGEICEGYQANASFYYMSLVPLTIMAVGLGAVLGWNVLGKSGSSGSRIGCGLAALVIGGVILGMISLFLMFAMSGGC